MAAKYPPYVNAYGNISKLFEEIKKASVPAKFTNNFLQTVLGLKSTSYRAMIPLLKKLGFIDQSNVPLKAYKDFRDNSVSKKVMADCIRRAYADLFQANEFAYKLKKSEITEKLSTITGTAKDDKNIPSVAGTFVELCKYADFESKPDKPKGNPDPEEQKRPKQPDQNLDLQNNKSNETVKKIGLSYTINLNLPATTEIEVYNSIFKSLKEPILYEE